MGVIRNATVGAHCLEHDMERAGVRRHFKFVMSSSEFSLRKPSLSLMTAGLSQLGLNPDQVWFVGDKAQFDVAGANGAGMISVWYNASGEEAGPHAADVTISSWAELAQML